MTDNVNKTSLVILDHEASKNAAIDPCISVSDAYYRYREKKVEE